MTKHADLALKSLFCTNSYTLPKITTKVVRPLPKMAEMGPLSGKISKYADTSVLYKLVYFAANR